MYFCSLMFRNAVFTTHIAGLLLQDVSAVLCSLMYRGPEALEGILEFLPDAGHFVHPCHHLIEDGVDSLEMVGRGMGMRTQS